MRSKKIKQLIKSLEEGIANQDKAIEQLIKETSKDLIELNKRQLFMGIGGDGRSLGRYKSKWYADFKRMLNPRGVVDLFLTGKFYSGFFVKSTSFPVTIDSRDKKRDKLVDQYGERIFRLTQESKKIYALGSLKVGIGKYWRKVLQLR